MLLIRFVKILRCSYLVNDVSIGVFNRLYLIKSIQSLNGQFEPKKTYEEECRQLAPLLFFPPDILKPHSKLDIEPSM